MARHLIQNAATGETRIVGDAALPFFPGWINRDTLDDAFPPSVFYGAGESDLRYVNVTELSDPTSAASVALRAALVPFWKPGETVAANAIRVNASGQTIKRNTSGTTRGSYDATEQGLWTVVSSGGGGGSGITPGTTAGQIPVWDGDSYEPQTPTAATAADIPVTPTGGIGATNVQSALAELDAEKITGIQVQDENGTAITGVTRLDFQGAGVTAAAGSGEVVVTIPGSGGGAATTLLARPRSADGSTTVVSIPGGAITTRAALQVAPNSLRYEPWTVSSALTIDALLANVTAAAATGTVFRMGVYAADEDWQPVGAPLADSGSIDALTTGVKTAVLGAPLTLPAGRYVAVTNSDGNPTLAGFGSISNGVGFLPDLTSGGFVRALSVASQNYGALPTGPAKWTTITSATTAGLLHFVMARISDIA